jgi:lipoate-protein ligase A
MENHRTTIGGTNAEVLRTHASAIEQVIGREVQVSGLTDLTLSDIKFSGNSQRRRLRTLMFHGTFLVHFDLQRIERYLKLPSKQPAYRQNRRHHDFLTNLPLETTMIKEAIRVAWRAHEEPITIPWARTQRLIQERYGSEQWNYRL